MKLKSLASSLILVIFGFVYVQPNIAHTKVVKKLAAHEGNSLKVEQEIEKLYLMYLIYFYVYKALKPNSIPSRYNFPPYSPTYPRYPYPFSL